MSVGCPVCDPRDRIQLRGQDDGSIQAGVRSIRSCRLQSMRKIRASRTGARPRRDGPRLARRCSYPTPEPCHATRLESRDRLVVLHRPRCLQQFSANPFVGHRQPNERTDDRRSGRQRGADYACSFAVIAADLEPDDAARGRRRMWSVHDVRRVLAVLRQQARRRCPSLRAAPGNGIHVRVLEVRGAMRHQRVRC